MQGFSVSDLSAYGATFSDDGEYVTLTTENWTKLTCAFTNEVRHTQRVSAESLAEKHRYENQIQQQQARIEQLLKEGNQMQQLKQEVMLFYFQCSSLNYVFWIR